MTVLESYLGILPAHGRYSQHYSLGGSSDAAFGLQFVWQRVFYVVAVTVGLLCSGADQVYLRVGRREADGGQSDGDVECELCRPG